MSKIEVYSCVTGKYDDVTKTLMGALPKIDCDVSFTLFTDSAIVPVNSWKVKKLAYSDSLCRRRIARWHKLNSHLLFPEAEITVWVDGSQQFKPIKLYEQLIGPYMQGSALATFKHPVRTCVYQEAQACRLLKKDNEKLINRQMDNYRKMGYPAFAGMVETACVVRKNKPGITAFNKLWWKELSENSLRDQLSFNYCASVTGLLYNTIPGHRVKSPFFTFTQHRS